MKTAVKIIAYFVWFAFSLGLSILFFRLVARLENRAGIFSPNIRFWTFLISWFGFVFLLAWLPIWLTKKRFPNFAWLMATVAVFLMMLLVCTISSEMIWDDFFAGKIYNCTDDNLGGFLMPGGWVHGNYVTVPKIDPSDSMSKPDSIREDWSIPKLWLLWSAFLVASLSISASLTFLIFRPRKPEVVKAISS